MTSMLVFFSCHATSVPNNRNRRLAWQVSRGRLMLGFFRCRLAAAPRGG
jgi:hypothetical protein